MENKVITLGCRLNHLESETIFERMDSSENIIVVNTCSVTKEAERQARQTIRRLKKENPNHNIIVTGCAAQTNAKQFEQMEEVSHIIGNLEKMSYDNISSKKMIKQTEVSQRELLKDTPFRLTTKMRNHSRGFVQIQNGCDHSCAFCIIRIARGPSHSMLKADIFNQVAIFLDKGYQDITLTGVDISSWHEGVNNKHGLGELCQEVLIKFPKLKRLRLSSLDPAVQDEALLECLASENRLMPHIHLSMQSASNRVLANMGRRHSKESMATWIEKLRQAKGYLSFGADIITGFPKESEEQFLETYNFIKEHKITKLHVFPYSKREGTAAAKMPNMDIAIRKARATRLRQLGAQLQQEWLQQFVGTKSLVLIEKNNKGYNEYYDMVNLDAGDMPQGSIVDVVITNIKDDELIGKPVFD